MIVSSECIESIVHNVNSVNSVNSVIRLCGGTTAIFDGIFLQGIELGFDQKFVF